MVHQNPQTVSAEGEEGRQIQGIVDLVMLKIAVLVRGEVSIVYKKGIIRVAGKIESDRFASIVDGINEFYVLIGTDLGVLALCVCQPNPFALGE